MEYEERIDRQQGSYVVASGTDFEDILTKEPIELITGIINVGEYTNLHNWFIRDCKYVGMLKNEGIKEALFFIGTGESNLFAAGGVYYDLTYIIQPDQIGKSYNPGTFRNAFLRQNKAGIYFWK
jgi:hypothetical protein